MSTAWCSGCSPPPRRTRPRPSGRACPRAALCGAWSKPRGTSPSQADRSDESAPACEHPAVPPRLHRLDVYTEPPPDNIALPLETADPHVWVRRAVYIAAADRQPIQIHVSWLPGLTDAAATILRETDRPGPWPQAVQKITGRSGCGPPARTRTPPRRTCAGRRSCAASTSSTRSGSSGSPSAGPAPGSATPPPPAAGPGSSSPPTPSCGSPATWPPASACPGSSPASPPGSPPPASAADSGPSTAPCPSSRAHRNPASPAPAARPARRTAGPPPATTSAKPPDSPNPTTQQQQVK
jgi:hypothetical protein